MPDARPQFDQVNLVVGDFARSLEFYRRLGVALPEPLPARGGAPFHVGGETANGLGFELDSAEFARVWNHGWAAVPELAGRVVLGFSVASRAEVDWLFAEITSAGYPALMPPHDAFWGARYAIVEDPNGVAVGLMSPADDAHRAPPPAGWP